jgi:hypothetical protein
VAYIDYQKAYDSVPHDWLTAVLEIYKIDPSLRNFLQHVMQGWKTKLCANGEESEPINILRGIFQGDSLSPL